MKAHFRSFARYNAWANRRLYEAAAGLDDAERRADQGAFFGSLHRTLNHLLVTDVIWIARLRGQKGPAWPLDHVAHDDFDDLRAAREALDDDLIACVDAFSEQDLGGVIRYQRVTSPDWHEQPATQALAHLFNHETHHRGQCHMILTRLSGRAPELDYLYFLREAA